MKNKLVFRMTKVEMRSYAAGLLIGYGIIRKHMKILSLNAWDGTQKDELKNFLGSQLDSTDIFCFQETLGATIQALFSELFPEAQYSTIWAEKTTDGNGQYNLCTVVKIPFQITNSQTVLRVDDIDIGQALVARIISPDGTTLTVVNVHGAPYPGHKLDTDGRLRQSDSIIDWLKDNVDTPTVICGDFNLLPEAESVKKFAAAGYQDLIREYKIPTTRNELAWKQWPNNIQLYADYAFVSPELKVVDFTVPQTEASDHLPMIIKLKI